MCQNNKIIVAGSELGISYDLCKAHKLIGDASQPFNLLLSPIETRKVVKFLVTTHNDSLLKALSLSLSLSLVCQIDC